MLVDHELINISGCHSSLRHGFSINTHIKSSSLDHAYINNHIKTRVIFKDEEFLR